MPATRLSALLFLLALASGCGGGGEGGPEAGPPPGAGPVLLRLDPLQGPVGTQVTLTLADPGGTPAMSFGMVPASVRALDGGRFLATVPVGARSGAVHLAFENGVLTWAAPFTVEARPPVLERMDPSRGAPGTVVVLTGTGFDRGLSVRFGDLPAAPLIPPTATTALVRVPPGVVPGPGDFTLEGLDGAGGTLLSVPFGARAGDSRDTDSYGVAFALPLDAARAGALHELRVLHGGKVLSRISGALPAGYPAPQARASGHGRVRVTWDHGRFPAVQVLDPRTGEVIGHGVSGSLELLTGTAELDLDLSYGVGSVRRRVPVH